MKQPACHKSRFEILPSPLSSPAITLQWATKQSCKKRKNQHKRIIPLAKIMRQSSNVQNHCSNRTFTKRGFTLVLIILHISSDWELQSNKGKICFWVPRHIQNRTIQTFVTHLWAMGTPFEFWLALALLDFVSSNRRKWSAEVFRKSPCCSTFEALRKIYIKIIHSKSEKVCGVCSPVQNILRKKCVNLNNEISRQKCVNHEMKLRFTRKWVY